jgi:large conductance mechanosensitive channel
MSSAASNSDTDRSPRVVRGVQKELGGFKKFLVRGNVVDLAVGVVIGAAFGNVVQSVVDNFINPLLGVFGGGPDLASWTIPVAGATIRIGVILSALISFALIAAVVYFLVVLPVNRLMDRYRPEPKPAPTKDCPECLSSIPQDARRCRECGAQLEPPSEGVVAAMRQVAAPSGAAIADEAAQVLRERLAGER